jgi:hypothetical protein
MFIQVSQEKAHSRHGSKVPLPVMLYSFLNVFLTTIRPHLFHSLDDGTTFQPKALWIDKKGSAMQYHAFTTRLSKISQQFNPYINVTSIQFRRMSITRTLKKIHISPNDFGCAEEFVERLQSYWNVTMKVMRSNYDRHDPWHEDSKVQQHLNEPRLKALSPQQIQQMEESNLQRASPQPSGIRVVSSTPQRPIRRTVSDKEWTQYLKRWKSQRKDQ